MSKFLRARLTSALWRGILAVTLAATALAAVGPDADADLSDRADFAPWVTNGRVYAITQVGDRIYVGGQFTAVAPDPDSAQTSRPFLAAFEARSGDYVSSFRPQLNSEVRTLASSADGTRLFVGGAFTQVNGESRRAIVAVDPETGATDTAWSVDAESGIVYDIEVDGDRVYLAGSFSGLGGVVGANRAARVDASNGRVDRNWRPAPNAQVEAIAIPPSGGRVYLGGRFASLGGLRADNLAAVNESNGSLIEDYDANAQCVVSSGGEGIRSIDATDDLVVAVPHRDNCAQVFRPGNRSRIITHTADGDLQVVHLIGDRFYIGGHSFTVNGITQARMFALTLDGQWDRSMTTDAGGQPGIFAYYGSGGNVWVGGSIWRLGDNSAINDLGRLGPERGATIPSIPQDLDVEVRAGGALVTWDRSSDPDGIAGYRVLRGNEQLAFVVGGDQTSYLDVRYREGEGNVYHVEAVDTDHNLSQRSDGFDPIRDAFEDVDAPSIPTNIELVDRSTTTITVAWSPSTDNVGVQRYELYRDGSRVASVDAPATQITDTGLAPATRYVHRVRAVDEAGNASDLSLPVVTTTTPAGDGEVVTAIAFGDRWSYLDNGSDQGTAWREADFDDSLWASGASELGFGDGDEATVLSFGPNPSSKYVTTYFRRNFTAPAGIEEATLQIVRDDGAAIYINGTQVALSNMPASFNYRTLASTALGAPDESRAVRFDVPAGVIQPGENTIAVEVHQGSAGSSDLSFNLELGIVAVAGDAGAPTTVLEAPADDAEVAGPTVTISGSTSDDIGIARVRVAIVDVETGEFLQSDASFAPERTFANAVLETPAAASTRWSFAATLADGRYRLIVKGVDVAGNVEGALRQTFTVSTGAA